MHGEALSNTMSDALVILGAAGIVIPLFARFRITYGKEQCFLDVVHNVCLVEGYVALLYMESSGVVQLLYSVIAGGLPSHGCDVSNK